MNCVLALLALMCAVSAYNNRAYVPVNYRRAEEPVSITSSEIAVKKSFGGDDDFRGLAPIPAYTEWLSEVDTAAAELNSHLLNPGTENNPNDPFVQYVMIVNAVNQLIDSSLNGVAEYYDVFYDVVSKVILETVSSPQVYADKVRAQADRTNSKISAIRDLIVHKQENACDEDISYTCDLIVGIAVETSGDTLLKEQARFMSILSVEVKLFLNEYAHVFNAEADNKRAPAYLINGIETLKPLVMAGVNARNVGKNIQPLRRFGGSYRHHSNPWHKY